jgi:hypothetical protein
MTNGHTQPVSLIERDAYQFEWLSLILNHLFQSHAVTLQSFWISINTLAIIAKKKGAY